MSSSKANPSFSKEAVICLTFDDIDDAITKHTFSAPSKASATASQEIVDSFDYSDEDEEDDEDGRYSGAAAGGDDVSTICDK